jgi:hypothetical protein
LAHSKPPAFPDYTFVHRDRPAGGCGGLAIFVHHSVPFTHINVITLTDFDQSLELLAIYIEIGSLKLDVYNVYFPPMSSCPASHCTDFATLFAFPSNDALILGIMPVGICLVTPVISMEIFLPLSLSLLTSASSILTPLPVSF